MNRERQLVHEALRLAKAAETDDALPVGGSPAWCQAVLSSVDATHPRPEASESVEAWVDSLVREALVVGAENSGIASAAKGEAGSLADDLVEQVRVVCGPPPSDSSADAKIAALAAERDEARRDVLTAKAERNELASAIDEARDVRPVGSARVDGATPASVLACRIVKTQATADVYREERDEARYETRLALDSPCKSCRENVDLSLAAVERAERAESSIAALVAACHERDAAFPHPTDDPVATVRGLAADAAYGHALSDLTSAATAHDERVRQEARAAAVEECEAALLKRRQEWLDAPGGGTVAEKLEHADGYGMAAGLVRALASRPAAEPTRVDPLHPNGKCRCAGEGRCAWCRAVAFEETHPVRRPAAEPAPTSASVVDDLASACAWLDRACRTNPLAYSEARVQGDKPHAVAIIATARALGWTPEHGKTSASVVERIVAELRETASRAKGRAMPPPDWRTLEWAADMIERKFGEHGKAVR